ncbi:MAG: VCBS repeat-containing protein [Gemmataceae bacterium]|nr:VCBS repeat-containing protein [Gemmataceae bacterium]
MRVRKRILAWFALTLGILLVAAWPTSAPAYIGGPPATLGHMCLWSTHVMTVQVERMDREKGVVIFRKVRDLKGKWPVDVIKQAIPIGLAERKMILDWAETGKVTVMFALESYKWSHTYIDNLWYASTTTDWSWWNVQHVEPIVLRTFSGRPERLNIACAAIVGGKEVVVPCMIGDNMQDLAQRKAKMQRLKASLKLTDYNVKRDFVDFGSDDFTRLSGMPGFSAFSPLPNMGLEAQAVSVVDFDGDGKPDFCLIGGQRVALMQNAGEGFIETTLPSLTGGCRSAVWADYNGDGKPDLLLATPNGPRLFTNLGNGSFRDDTAMLPKNAGACLAAAWIDYDGDGKPDILLAGGYQGLRLYRNKGPSDTPAGPLVPGKAPVPGLWFEDVSAKVGFGPDGIGSTVKGDTLTVCDVNGDGRPDFLYGAGTGMLFLNTPEGFVEATDTGIRYKTGKVGPVFADFDNSGTMSLFVPQLSGGCKLFKNDGKGKFTDVTAKTGDLAKFQGMATCAAWGDVDNDGRVDLVIGCLRGPNRCYRNKGEGTFEDMTEGIGLNQRIFNTQGVALVDLNGDGVLDMVFINEGQASCVLLGNADLPRKKTALTVQVNGTTVLGSQVRVLTREGKLVVTQDVASGAGRGGQVGSQAHFALEPGAYRVEVRYGSGNTKTKGVIVENMPVRTAIDEK